MDDLINMQRQRDNVISMFRAHKLEHGADVPFICLRVGDGEGDEFAMLNSVPGERERVRFTNVLGPAYYHGVLTKCVKTWCLHEHPGCFAAIVFGRLDGVLIAMGWRHEDECGGQCSLCRKR